MENKKITSKDLMLLSTNIIRDFLDESNVPKEIRLKLVRGISFGYKKDRNAVVELYMPGEMPSDAIVILTFKIDKFTGKFDRDVHQENLNSLLSTVSPLGKI